MKRKVYATRRERMRDQILGFLAFPLLNVSLGIILWAIKPTIDSSLLMLLPPLPWIVNGIVIVVAFLLRPEFAIGYIAFICAILALVIALSVVVVAACFVIIPLAPVMGDLVNLLFLLLVAAGLFGVAAWSIDLFTNWWSAYKNNSQ